MTSKTNTSRSLWRQRGVMHMPVLLACIIIIGIFAIGWTIAKRQPSQDTSPGTSLPTGRQTTKPDGQPVADAGVTWEYHGADNGWHATGGAAPACPQPLLSRSPVEIGAATAVLLPGQYRGTHYKAHGGFRYDASKSTDIEARLPFDAKLTGLVRYIESGELQYLLTFQHACGYMLRFDHLAALSDDFMKIAQTTPEPKADDTRSLPLKSQPSFKAGTTVATAIGHAKTNNIGLDIGLYDLRTQNTVSKDPAWATLHRNESEQTFHAVCWLTMLPPRDAAVAKRLMSELPADAKGASDYCDGAPGGSTLQYDGGRAPQ